MNGIRYYTVDEPALGDRVRREGGDVLSVETRVKEKIESPRRHGVGTVKIESRVLNQRDEAVMTLSSLVLYQSRATA